MGHGISTGLVVLGGMGVGVGLISGLDGWQGYEAYGAMASIGLGGALGALGAGLAAAPVAVGLAATQVVLNDRARRRLRFGVEPVDEGAKATVSRRF